MKDVQAKNELLVIEIIMTALSQYFFPGQSPSKLGSTLKDMSKFYAIQSSRQEGVFGDNY